MNTNHEKDFVPYEQALALKELGFDEPCIAFATITYKDVIHCGIGFKVHKETDLPTKPFSVPTWKSAFRWFREKHNIDAWVQPFVSEKQNGKPFLPDESYAYYIFEDGVYVADGVNFLDSEEAELECLKKLIEITKNK